MDSLIASAARLLTAGDPLGALKRVALRDDPSALALRGIAMAQLGGYGTNQFADVDKPYWPETARTSSKTCACESAEAHA
jgi:hypothetical protein